MPHIKRCSKTNLIFTFSGVKEYSLLFFFPWFFESISSWQRDGLVWNFRGWKISLMLFDSLKLYAWCFSMHASPQKCNLWKLVNPNCTLWCQLLRLNRDTTSYHCWSECDPKLQLYRIFLQLISSTDWLQPMALIKLAEEGTVSALLAPVVILSLLSFPYTQLHEHKHS